MCSGSGGGGRVGRRVGEVSKVGRKYKLEGGVSDLRSGILEVGLVNSVKC